MRRNKDRRHPLSIACFPLEDNDRERVYSDRRKLRERRLDRMEEDERQLQFSEMPSPTKRNE